MMTTKTKVFHYRRPIFGLIVAWIYTKLGYTVEHVIELFRTVDEHGLPNNDGGLSMRCTK